MLAHSGSTAARKPVKPAEVPEESERWIAVIGVLGRRDTGVEPRDRGVVPGLDRAEVDVGDRGAIELQAGLHAGEVVETVIAPRNIGSAQPVRRPWRAPRVRRSSAAGRWRRSRLSWTSSAVMPGAGADGLVVDGEADPGARRAPLFVDGGREGGACAGDRGGRCRVEALAVLELVGVRAGAAGGEEGARAPRGHQELSRLSFANVITTESPSCLGGQRIGVGGGVVRLSFEKRALNPPR